MPVVSYVKVRSKIRRNMKTFCEKFAMEYWYIAFSDFDTACNNCNEMIYN